MRGAPLGLFPTLAVTFAIDCASTMRSSTDDFDEDAKRREEGGTESVLPTSEWNIRRKKKKKKRKEAKAVRNQAETKVEEGDGESSRTGEAAHR